MNSMYRIQKYERLSTLLIAIFALVLCITTFGAKAATITVGSSATTCALASNQYSNSSADCAVLASDLQTDLNSNSITITSNGNINIESALSWSQNGLILTAANNINVNAVMTVTGTGAVTMTASTSWDKGILMGWNSDFTFKGKINYTSTGQLTINSTAYTVITTLGSEGSTSQIDLQGMKGNLAGNYALGGDIAIGATDDSWNSGKGFSPVGDVSSVFTGKFYGLGHTISGLSVTPGSTYSSGAGLFGESTGRIYGVGVTNVDILASGNSGYGGLAGTNGGVISNSYTTGTVRTYRPDYSGGTGGLVGVDYYGYIFGSYSAANVSTRNDHTTTTDIQATLGGLVGTAIVRDIKESFAIGNVGGSGKAGTAKMMGGLIGELRFATLNDVYATGSVTSDAGGATTMFASTTQGENPTGSVPYAPYVGGLVGLMYQGTASNGYATGAVSSLSGSSNMGGFLGKITGTGAVSNSFWNTTTSGQSSGLGGGSSSSGVNGKTTTEMQSGSTYISASYSPSYWGLKSGVNNDFAVLRAFYPDARFNAVPVATITSAPDVTTAGGTTYTVRMTYTDADGTISAASIGNNNIDIAGLSYASFSIISGSGTATTVVDYVFTPPGGSWNVADNGTYTIALGSSPVTDDQSAAVTALTAGGADTSITVNIAQAATTTTLDSLPNPSTYGGNVTFTATVSPSAATGTVDFKDGGTSISGCASQTLTSGVATCAILTLSVGNHPISAVYSGDTDYLTSTGTLTGGQTVNQISQTITGFTFTPTTLAIGGTTTASATGGGSGNPVTFSSTTTGVCTVSGTNNETVNGVAAGTCTIAANQTGNTNYNAAAQVTNGIVVPAPALTPATQNVNGTVGSPISATTAYTATGFTGAVSYTISPALPTGLSLSSTTGVISGTPTATQTATTHTVTGTGATSGTATATVNVTVVAGPALSPATQTVSGSVGSSISATTAYTATGFTGAVSYTISPVLSAGLSLDSATGVISGTPTATQTATSHTVTGTGATSGTATATVNVTVVAGPALSPATQTVSGSVGSAISATTAYTATGFTGAVSYTISPDLPAGLSLSSTTGVISGTPTATQTATTHTVTGTGATSGTATATVSLTITAGPALSPATQNVSGSVGSAISATTAYTATGFTGAVSYTISPALPAGLSLSSTTGVISGTPTAAQTATTHTVTGTGATSGTANATVNVTVVAGPALSPATQNVNGSVGSAISATTAYTATGFSGVVSYTISPALPAGLSLSSTTGVISGTPTAAQTATTHTVTGTGATSGTATATVSLSIGSVADLPTLSTPGLPNGVVGIPYAATFGASGGEPPYAYSGTGLPTGLSLSADGVLSGIPTTPGAATVVVIVTDHQGQTGERSYLLTIATDLAVVTPSLITGLTGATYGQTLAAVGGKLPYVWSLFSGTLPAGLSLDSATGILSGTPTVAGVQTFTVQVIDSLGQTAQQPLILTIQAPSLTRPDPVNPSSPPISAGLTVNPGAGATCTLNDQNSFTFKLGENGVPANGPPGVQLPNGLMQVVVEGCTPGETTLTLTLVYPQPLPAGTQVWKYGPTAAEPTPHWYVMPGAVIQGNTVTYTVRDGGLGDDDLVANGTIIDPAGPGIPTLNLSGALPMSGQVGQAYSGTLTATAGIGPYVWSVAAGTLPAGLSLATPTTAATTVSGTPTQAGTFAFTIQVVDQGNGNTAAQQTFTVQIAGMNLTYTVTPSAGAGGAIQPATPQTVASGAAATFTVIADSGYTLAAVSGCNGALTGTTYTTGAITADCGVHATFNAVGRQNQTISFAALSDKLLGDPPYPVSATASSGLPVSFTASGTCTVAGNTVTLTGVGTCTLTARQGGDTTYNPAPDVVQGFAITAPPVDIPTLSEWAMLLLTLLLSGLAGRQLAAPTVRRR